MDQWLGSLHWKPADKGWTPRMAKNNFLILNFITLNLEFYHLFNIFEMDYSGEGTGFIN